MVLPGRCGKTYRTAVYHAAGNGDTGRELEALSLQGPVHLSQISEFVTALCSGGPGLDEFENFGAHFGDGSTGADSLQQRDQALHKLSGCDLGEEVGATILDAGVGELDGLATKSSKAGFAARG
jgi:hypothetical protein